MQSYTDVLFSANGPVPNVSVTVKTSPGAAVATIYSDNGVTTITNPIVTGNNGRFLFYAADGYYTLTISGTGITTQTVGPILLQDYATTAPIASKLAAATGAALVGTTGPSTVQADITARPTSATLSASSGSSLVGFSQSGTGAVATTVQGELRKTIWANQFGALLDGVTDDTANLQKAFTYAATFVSAEVVFPPCSAAKCNSGLTVDTNRIGIKGNGSWLDFSGMTTGKALTITQSNATANIRNYLNHLHPIAGLLFLGPGNAITAVGCVQIDNSVAPNTVSGGVFRDCAFVNFANDVNLGSGAFCWDFDHCNFTLTGAADTTFSITVPVGTNSGERNTFTKCVWNNRKNILSQTNTAADTHFENCSFDGFIRAMTITAGSVSIHGGHIENTDDTDYGFHLSADNNAILTITDASIQYQAAKTVFSPFYSDVICTNGGIVISGVRLAGGFTGFTVPLIAGAGRALISNISIPAGQQHPVLSAYQNVFAYGGLESASYSGEWTLSGGTPPVRSVVQARTGTYSLSFPGAVGNTPLALRLIPVKPGQFVTGELYYKVLGITGTSGTFYIQIDWLDAGGVILSNAGPLIRTTDQTSWTRVDLSLIGAAPTGTVNWRIQINIFGIASGTPLGYVDDVIVNVS